MSEIKLFPISKPIIAEMKIPGDKSISHRAIMLGSLAEGRTEVTNFLDGEDCMHTINAFRSLGVSIEINDQTVIVNGKGASKLKESTVPMYFGNSGTTTRLMLGLLAGLPFYSTIYGDQFLTERPMNRVVNPLREMGVLIDGRENGNLLPLSIRGGNLNAIHYTLPVKSAQVKSAILLAGIHTEGKTTIVEETKTRDHTERLLAAFGADIEVNGNEVSVTNKNIMKATDVIVPGDISSASFFMVAAAIVPDSNLLLKDVGLNETRTGIIDIMIEMGANIEIDNERVSGGETLGNIKVMQKELTSITIEDPIIPRLIDEIPIIALLATQINGTTIIKNAEELRVKETDRIAAVVDVLSTLGANIEATEDGMVIQGNTPLNGGSVSSYSDHRIAMMIAIASLISSDAVIMDDASSIAVSYPGFFDELQRLTK